MDEALTSNGAEPEDSGVSLARKIEWEFWLPQLADHASFLSYGLSVPDLKERASDLEGQLRSQFEAVRHLGGSAAVGSTQQIVAELRALKIEVATRQEQGEFVGLLSPTMLDHMRVELDFFVETVTGETDSRVAFDVHLRLATDAAGVVASMVDPQESAAIEAARWLQDELRQLSSRCADVVTEADAIDFLKTVQLEREFFQGLVGPAKTQNVFLPGYLQHSLKELERAITFLWTLQPLDS